MQFFTEIPEGQAIVHSKGVYRQVPIYGRGDKVYAKYGAGFVRLSTGGATSCPTVRWSEIDHGFAEIIEKDGSSPRLFQIHDKDEIRGAAE